MSDLMQDVRYGLRTMLRTKSVTGLAMIALILGIGANTAIFSVIYTVLLSPLPYANPDQLVMVWGAQPEVAAALGKVPIAPGDFVDYQQQNSSFDQLAAIDIASLNLTGSDDVERVIAAAVSHNLFDLLGAKPMMGRVFTADEDRPGNDKVVVISYNFWQRRFGMDRQVVGRSLQINNMPYTVIGVMPASFQFPRASDMPRYFGFPQVAQMWVPIALSDERLARRRNHDIAAIGRLKPGVTLAQAQADMQTVAARVENQYPENKGWGINLVALRDQVVGDIRLPLLILIGAVGFVLLIACANVANLLLARGTTRRRELALRLALGATRQRIIKQLLTESVLLALISGALGIAFSYLGLKSLLSLSPTEIPRVEEIGINTGVLLFTLGVSIATGLIFGIIPSLQATGQNLSDTLKEGSRGATSGRRQHRTRNLLIVLQFATALVLLVGSGLMIRSFMRLLNVAPGFQPDHVMTMRVELPEYSYPGVQEQREFYKRVLEEMSNMPGVKSAGITFRLPLIGDGGIDNFIVEGRPTPLPGQEPILSVRMVNPTYFETMGIPIIQGRNLNDQDTKDTPTVVVVSQTMAATYWPGESALGKRIKVGGHDHKHGWEDQWITVVGIAGDVKSSLNEPPPAIIYFHYQQISWPHLTFVARTNSDPETVAGVMRNAIRRVDPNLPVLEAKSMPQYLTESVARQRFSMVMMAIFGAIALLLAAIGIYSVMTYAVIQRTHEIGIRMAMGAQKGQILKMVLRQGFGLVLVGLGLGLIGAFILTRILENLLFQVSATDPVTFALIPMLLAAVAIVATLVPAMRATRVDPIVALRAE